MKEYFGYMPAIIVWGPVLTALIRQAIFYKGCMDGCGFVFIAMFAFCIGGLLNLLFLASIAVLPRYYFSCADEYKKKIAKGGMCISLITLMFQIVIIGYFSYLKMRSY